MDIRLIAVTIITLIFTHQAIGNEYDYPKSKEERQMDEIGSLLGGDGLTFRPARTRNTSTKSTIGNVNKYLYQATIEVLKFPIISADSSTGVIVTDWYTMPSHPGALYKITVYIKDDVISPSALEVHVFEKIKKNGKYGEPIKKSPLSLVFENDILRRARELYIISQRNK